MARCHLTFLGQRLNVSLYLHDMQPLVFGLWLRPVGGDTPAGLDLSLLNFGDKGVVSYAYGAYW